MSVVVLTMCYWPTYTPMTVHIPQQVSDSYVYIVCVCVGVPACVRVCGVWCVSQRGVQGVRV